MPLTNSRRSGGVPSAADPGLRRSVLAERSQLPPHRSQQGGLRARDVLLQHNPWSSGLQPAARARNSRNLPLRVPVGAASGALQGAETRAGASVGVEASAAGLFPLRTLGHGVFPQHLPLQRLQRRADQAEGEPIQNPRLFPRHF